MKLEDYDLKVLDHERAFIWETSVEEDEYSEFRDADVARGERGLRSPRCPAFLLYIIGTEYFLRQHSSSRKVLNCRGEVSYHRPS